MRLIVGIVEGKTSSKGSKQGRTYNLISGPSEHGFYDAVTDTKKEVMIWNVYGDWSKVGICKKGSFRFSYTTEIKVEND